MCAAKKNIYSGHTVRIHRPPRQQRTTRPCVAQRPCVWSRWVASACSTPGQLSRRRARGLVRLACPCPSPRQCPSCSPQEWVGDRTRASKSASCGCWHESDPIQFPLDWIFYPIPADGFEKNQSITSVRQRRRCSKVPPLRQRTPVCSKRPCHAAVVAVVGPQHPVLVTDFAVIFVDSDHLRKSRLKHFRPLQQPWWSPCFLGSRQPWHHCSLGCDQTSCCAAHRQRSPRGGQQTPGSVPPWQARSLPPFAAHSPRAQATASRVKTCSCRSTFAPITSRS